MCFSVDLGGLAEFSMDDVMALAALLLPACGYWATASVKVKDTLLERIDLRALSTQEEPSPLGLCLSSFWAPDMFSPSPPL